MIIQIEDHVRSKAEYHITKHEGFFSTFYDCHVWLIGGGLVSRQSEDRASLVAWAEKLGAKEKQK